MCNLIRCKENLLIKGTAFATVLCLMFANLPMYAYAGEGIDELHNTSDEEGNAGETSGVSHTNSVYNLFNNDDTKDQEKKDEEIKDQDTKNEETKKEEIKNQEKEDEEIEDQGQKNEEIKKEEIKKEEIKDQEKEDEEIKDQEKEDGKDNKKDTVSGNDTEDVEKEDEEESEKDTEDTDTISGNDIGETKREEQEIIDVVVPTTYTLALNPYRLPIITGEDETTTEQIVSGNYGIVNKSSTDLVVTVSLTVEDRSGEGLVFVDSAEEAEDAGMDVYAIYLAAVPADEGEILIGDGPVDGDVTAVSLRDVSMTGAAEQAVALHAGDNQIAFKLTGAEYAWETGEGSTEETAEEEMDREGEAVTQTGEQAGEEREAYVFQGLAAEGRGVTAYTFYGVMNPDAEWERLSGGIRLSVVYSYQTAEGDEEIMEGTGTMIRTEEEPSGEE